MEGLTGSFFSYDIKVALRGLTHQSPADLDVMLQYPEGGFRTLLMSDDCAADTGQNSIVQPIDLTFELGSTTTPFIPADTPCTTGTYRPFDDDDDPESPFTGPDNFPAPAPLPPPPPCNPPSCIPTPSPGLREVNGTWNLWVVDDTPGTQGVSGGQFAGGWSLEFTVRPPPPTLSISDATVTEGNAGTSPAIFTVSLADGPASGVTVDYAVADSSARAGEDYIAIPPGTLTFAPGEKSKTISVNVIGDTVVEETEFFAVDLSNAQGASLVRSTGLGTILDNSGATTTTTTSPVNSPPAASPPAPATPAQAPLSPAPGTPVSPALAPAVPVALAPQPAAAATRAPASQPAAAATAATASRTGTSSGTSSGRLARTGSPIATRVGAALLIMLVGAVFTSVSRRPRRGVELSRVIHLRSSMR